jgi:hypothetical protein
VKLYATDLQGNCLTFDITRDGVPCRANSFRKNAIGWRDYNRNTFVVRTDKANWVGKKIIGTCLSKSYHNDIEEAYQQLMDNYFGHHGLSFRGQQWL